MRSIGARLGISLFVSLLLAGVLVGQGALWWLEREQRRISAGQLRDEAASVLAAMVPGPDGLVLEQEMLGLVHLIHSERLPLPMSPPADALQS